MTPLPEIAAFLLRVLDAGRFPDDPCGVLAPAPGPVRRLGLALEPDPALAAWAGEHRLDALLLHRPWPRPDAPLPEGVGLLALHLPLDDRLTPGYSPRLAAALELEIAAPLEDASGRVIGMLGSVPDPRFARVLAVAEEAFGGVEAAEPPSGPGAGLVAVVGAMGEGMVREAARRGATCYLTGQLRHPARAALAETGIGAIAVGHRRAEMWGLRALAGVLRERWARLEVRVFAAAEERC